MRRGNKGFTLVELSIVLVIIGLVASGVMVGQELLKVGKIRSVYAEYNKIKTSMNTFTQKYGAWPGDISNAYAFFGSDCAATVSDCNGDGDRQMLWWGESDSENGYERGIETLMVWRHMSIAKMFPDDYSGSCGSGVGCSLEISSNVAGSSWSDASAWHISSLFYNKFMLGSPEGEIYNAVIDVGDAYLIDSKYDDGVPGKGSITWLTGANSFPLQCWTGLFPVQTEFNLAEANAKCVAHFNFAGDGKIVFRTSDDNDLIDG